MRDQLEMLILFLMTESTRALQVEHRLMLEQLLHTAKAALAHVKGGRP
jgi:hypothetical protein